MMLSSLPPVTTLHKMTAKDTLKKGKHMNEKLKIVVIGGTGLIGTKLVNNLRERGHEVLAASPQSGVNTFTGEGLATALEGAQVVVDVANAPQWDDKAVMEFFQTAGRNLLAAEAAAGVRHHVALSIVGTDRLPGSGYMRAKVAQENLIKASGIPAAHPAKAPRTNSFQEQPNHVRGRTSQ